MVMLVLLFEEDDADEVMFVVLACNAVDASVSYSADDDTVLLITDDRYIICCFFRR